MAKKELRILQKMEIIIRILVNLQSKLKFTMDLFSTNQINVKHYWCLDAYIEAKIAQIVIWLRDLDGYDSTDMQPSNL